MNGYGDPPLFMGRYNKLTIVASKSLLETFPGIDSIRQLLTNSVDELEPAWFESNFKLIAEAQKQHFWPPGLDCVNWPDLKILRNGEYVHYPIDIIPCSPDYVFICCATDSTTVPAKENNLYAAAYPECMDVDNWKPITKFVTLVTSVADGMHRTKLEIGKMFHSDESAGLHDAVFDACGKSLSVEELEKLWITLPLNIRSLAEEWGFNDTEFHSKVCEWIKKEGTNGTN